MGASLDLESGHRSGTWSGGVSEASPSHRISSSYCKWPQRTQKTAERKAESPSRCHRAGRNVRDFRQLWLPRGLPTVTNAILLVTVLVNESHCSNLHESEIIIFLLSQHWWRKLPHSSISSFYSSVSEGLSENGNLVLQSLSQSSERLLGFHASPCFLGFFIILLLSPFTGSHCSGLN